MSQPDYAKVLIEVKRVLKENAITELPISPEEIAGNYGIKIQYVIFKPPHEDIAGFFDFQENKIYVNGDDPYNRRTFTIAHELGHNFLHKELFKNAPQKYTVLLRRPMASVNDSLEKEANAFAAQLLVPKEKLDKYVNCASTGELAKLFTVSQDVIRNRLRFEYGY